MSITKSKVTYHNQQMAIMRSRGPKLMRIRVIGRKREGLSAVEDTKE